MNDQHPITPPPELVQQWCLHSNKHETADQFWRHIATQAAQWGSDQELEACCKDIIEIIAGVFADRVIDDWGQFVELLRDGRRPQPPSLKEQAFDALGRFAANAHTQASQMNEDFDTLRRALEALPE